MEKKINENDKMYDIATLYKRDVELHNDFIFYGSYDFGEVELKIVHYLAMNVDSKVDYDEAGNPIYRTIYPITFKRFCASTGMPRNGESYNEISNAIKMLTIKNIEILRPNNSFTDLRFILRRTEFVNPNNRFAVVEIDERLMPFLVNKKYNFTKNPGQYVLRLRGKYPQRVYMNIKAQMDKERGQEIKQFRARYGKEYKNYDDEIKKSYIKLTEELDTKLYNIPFELVQTCKSFCLPKSLQYVSRLKNKIIKPSMKTINQLGAVIIEDVIEDKKNEAVICITRYKTPLELYETDKAIEEALNKIKDFGPEEENNYDKSVFSIENGVFVKGDEIYKIEELTDEALSDFS